MKRTKFLVGLFVAFIVVSILINVQILSAKGSEKEKITLTYSTAFPEASYLGKVDKWWMNEVTERTGGKVQFETYYSGALAGSKESLPATKKGIIDISHLPESYFSEELPLGTLTNSVSLVESPKKVHDAAYKLHFESGEVSDYFRKEAKKQNLVYLQCPPMHYTLFSRQKITTLEDLKNKSIRSTGVYYPRIYSKLGANGVDVLPGEWYDAMSRGTIDAIRLPHSLVSSFNIHEVSNYVSFDWGSITGQPAYMNRDTWNSLPRDVQEVFKKMRKEYWDYSWKNYWDYIDTQTELIKEEGVEITEMTPELKNAWFGTSLEVVKKEFLSRTKKLGIEKEGQKVFKRWLELLDIEQ